MTHIRRRRRHRSWLLGPLAVGVLTACGGADQRLDEQLKADLAAASQAPSNRGQFASPAELGYPQGYPAPQPQAPQVRVVYVPQQSTVRRTSSTGASAGSGGGSIGGSASGARGTGNAPANTQKGAIIGAAAGAAIGVATSRDKVKGGAIGALGGAVLGGLIGHQVKKP
mgnify:CR=1 FL=1